MADSARWRQLAENVTKRRQELGLTQAAIQAMGGPSVATVRLIEAAAQTTYRATVLARLERALGWAPGSIDAILAGGEPKLGEPERPRHDLEAELRTIRDDTSMPSYIRRQAQANLDAIAALLDAARDAGRRAS